MWNLFKNHTIKFKKVQIEEDVVAEEIGSTVGTNSSSMLGQERIEEKVHY